MSESTYQPAHTPLLTPCCDVSYQLTRRGAQCLSCGDTASLTDGILHLVEACDVDLRICDALLDMHALRKSRRYYDRDITSDVEYAARKHSIDFSRFHATLLDDRLEGAIVADLGCGQLIYGDALAGKGIAQYYGVDLDLPSLHLANRWRPAGLPATFVRHGIGSRLPFEDNSIDVVISCQVIEHLDNPMDHLREIRRILVPGGVLSVSAPCGSMYLQLANLLRALKRPRNLRTWLDRLRCHRHWNRALEWHPAVMPAVLKAWCESAGSDVLQQGTRLWYYTSRIAASWRIFSLLERLGLSKAGDWYGRYLCATDELLDAGIPLIKWLGTRPFALCTKGNG